MAETLKPAAPPLSIPFNRADMVGREWDYLADSLREMHISGDGKYTRRCSELLAGGLAFEGVAPTVLLTTSCTHALEMAAILLDVKEGDEVVVPSFTFVSTVNAFVLRGARPVFADVRPDTLNLDERTLDERITSRTRAIVPVHYAGVGCEMDAIMDIARQRGIAVVEDNAHGLFGRYRGRPLGTFGCLATQSFHETKNFSCGEGGALVLNDPALVRRAEIVREKGTDRSRFFRGEVDKYSWVDTGSSYLPSDMLAAFLLAQLEARETIQHSRHRIWNRYWDLLEKWANENGVGLPTVPPRCEHPAHLFYLVLPDAASRDHFIAHLRSHGILSVFHYVPLHLSAMGRKFGGKAGDCPVTESLADRLVRLPLFTGLTEAQQETVVETIRELRFP